MLHIVTGPFQPVLDRALVEDIRSLKSDNPFHPVTVIVPSSGLAEHLKWMFAVESQLSFLNLQVLTFHQFALRLRDDLARGGSSKSPLQLVDDFYFEQLVRQIVRRRLPALKPLANLPPASGTWRGLWATIRDLKDAAVNPATMYTALDEGVFEAEDRPWLGAISTLQAAILEAGQSLGIGSPDDLTVSLTPRCSESPFLAGLKAILYYGFYDLSQVQLSFFEAVTRCTNTTLYFPLTPHPAFSFARRFFERYLLPLASSHDDRNLKPLGSYPPCGVELLVTNVVGAEEELAAACREIVRLVEIHDYRLDEIGVVARSLEPYQARLQAVFDRHLVPFSSTGSRPLMREPLVKALLRLASLPVNDFDRSAVLDVVASPWYRIQQDGDLWFAPRPDLWRIMASNLGITKGQSEWARLSDAAASSILKEALDLREEEETARVTADDPGQLRLFSILVTNLIQDCDALPRQGSIVELTQAFRSVIQSHMSIPGWTSEAAPATPTEPHIYEIGSLVGRTLERLLEFEPLGVELSWKEWTEWFRLALEETELPIEGGGHRGVQVLDAMTARGLRFRALFI
ncbi:PD-(D/E)XK nuclease family protein, partial [Petrachloros mirabilis]